MGLLRAVGPRPGGWGTPFQPALTEGLSCERFREHVLLVTVDSVPYCIYLQLWEKMQRIVCWPKGPFGVTWTIFSRLHSLDFICIRSKYLRTTETVQHFLSELFQQPVLQSN